MNIHTIKLLGVNINTYSEENLINILENHLLELSQCKIFTPNPEFIVETRTNKNFLNVLNRSSLNLPDGIGIIWAVTFLSLPNRFKFNVYLNYTYNIFQLCYSLLSLIFVPSFCRSKIPDRVSGADFFWRIVEICHRQNKRIFLLGGKSGVAEIVRDRLITVYPKLQVAGTFAGSPDILLDNDICHIINQSCPDVLFVAYGAPNQEMWIDRNLDRLNTVKIAMGVGGTFDFVSGTRKRAPIFMRKLGLEWLYRLFLTPSRIKRIYNATIKFVLIVFKVKISGVKS